jgi:hypothetical protein
MRQLKISKSITTRDAALDKYLQEISREPMISIFKYGVIFYIFILQFIDIFFECHYISIAI